MFYGDTGSIEHNFRYEIIHSYLKMSITKNYFKTLSQLHTMYNVEYFDKNNVNEYSTQWLVIKEPNILKPF